MRQTTILLVDDKSGTMIMENEWLGREGYNVINAFSGEEAYEKIKTSHGEVDLILMEISLGGRISGIKAASAILKIKDLPILFYSSCTDEHLIRKTEETGAYGFVAKSSSPAVLLASIKMALKSGAGKKEIRGNEMNLRFLIDQTGEGICFVDPEENIIFSNRMGDEIFGTTPERLEGRNLREFYEPGEFEKILSETTERRKGNKSVFETVIKLARGQEKTILVTANPMFSDEGEFLGTFSIFRDITIRRKAMDRLMESERKLNDLAQNSPGIVFQYCIREDGSAYFSYLNEKASQLFGRKLDLMNPDWSLAEFIPLNDRQRMAKSISEAVKNSSSWEYEGEFICIDGINRWFQARAVPAFSDTEMAYNGILIEITEKKKAELLLKKYSEELKYSNATKDKFFSILAHDLRSPFTGFIGITEDLVNNLDSLSHEDIKEYASALNSSSKKMYDLLTNLLEWSRLQTGKIEFKPEVLNLFSAAYESTALFFSAAMNKSIEIENLIDKDINITADLYSLDTIIRNLVSNSLKFTNEGGKITLRSLKLKDSAELRITDSGIGMTEEVMEKVFIVESLYTTSGTMGEKGTGLGLALCKELSLKNSWDISVKSRLNEGTEFSLLLPLAKDIQ
ncbi:MAG: PAS domain S-box protein [Ignavibacteria bacterium]|jgi:PAS domain S-box-containing protein|nr:PAS domain S-box protein [Ignavibacteria bacterium]MCU7501375.1 PAS domain S-box protein [Ignavibacteria bacterium]MCU7514693.1 PAS domain S-box protein [Ignavibacteria bacterium]MCU7518548.1 PAS domain S-box protein [Ignavibacteria bacterium]